MRSLSAPARRAIYAQQTGEAFLVLLTLTHASFAPPIRVCSDARDVSSVGQTYVAFPFEVGLPPERDEGPFTVQLRIANADRRIVQAVRTASGEPVQVELRVVLASSPDLTEAGPFAFALRDVEYDAEWVTGTLMFEDVLNEPFPAREVDPNTFPGVF